MASRNIQNHINEGRTITEDRPGLGLNMPVVIELMKRADSASASRGDALFNAISEAYLTGLAVGIRNAKGKETK